MIGLLRNGPSIHKGLSSGYTPSKTDAVFYWTGEYDGTSLVNAVDTNVPWVSGTGLDAIYDFSVLNDPRFDKGSYVGNSFGLPETYNFPYDGIYYDDTSAATRYHWKLTDFAYAVILNQTVDENIQNVFFLKAKATTNTSNEISSVSGLYIYATSLADSNLSKMKRYIGIQADFYGDNLIKNGDFTNGFTDWIASEPQWSVVNNNAVYDGSAFGSLHQKQILIQNIPIVANLTISSQSGTSGFASSEFLEDFAERKFKVGTNDYNLTPTSSAFQMFGTNGNVTIDKINSVKHFYQNYYKS